MSKPEWKDWVAVGGLALGLFNSWLLIFRKRPFLYLEPFPAAGALAGERRLRLRLTNPSQLPLQITGLTIWRQSDLTLQTLAPRVFIYPDEESTARWFIYRQRRLFRDFIAGDETRYYSVSDIDEHHFGAVIFWWHRNGFLSLRLPLCLLLSERRLAPIFNDPPDIQI